MGNIVLIVLGFCAIFGLTMYLYARINVKYMVKAIDIEGNIFKELIKNFKNGKDIKNLKSIKKNIESCKLMQILLFLITIIILIAVEIVMLNYNLRGLKLYNALLIIYFIYNMIGLLSNKYKQIITSEYAYIFTCLLELKAVYDYDLNKIPFVNKLEIYNSADNKIKFNNKKGNSGYDSPETLVLETYIENFRDSTAPKNKEKNEKNSDKQLHYEEREDGIFKIWEAKSDDNLKITIMKGGLGPYSVYVKKNDIVNGIKRGSIEIASHKCSNLSEAKEIANKIKDTALKYVAPGIERTNSTKILPTSLDFKEKRDDQYGFTMRETNVDEDCKIKIIKSDRQKEYSAFVKIEEREVGRTGGYMGYIDASSHRGVSLSEAKIIAEKLYNLVISYKIPGIGDK